MSTIVQYNFFETKEESEFKALENRVEEVDISCNKIRKALFARHGEMNKRQIDLEQRLEILERYLCSS